MQGRSTIIGMTNGSAEKALTDLQGESRGGQPAKFVQDTLEFLDKLSPEQRQALDTDFTLDATLLDDKYNPEGDGEHPVFSRTDWRAAVEAKDTIIGYWDWVEYRIELVHALV